MRSHGDMKGQRPRRGVRFERHASQIVFDPASSTFVVTWVKCDRPPAERIAAQRDPLTWMPSISAIATLFDRGCIPQDQVVFAARAVCKAWSAGDRDSLDTEGAKKAAELVADLSSMCVDPTSQSVAMDIGQAMRHLLDEMSSVRFLNTPDREFEDSNVLPALEKATKECFGVEAFGTWPAASMRRRFLYCLNKKERTQVAYTLVSLLFDNGACPLLPLTGRRVLRMQAIRHSGIDADFIPDTTMEFFRYALEKMRDAKKLGMSMMGGKVTQQQMADSVLGESSPISTK